MTGTSGMPHEALADGPAAAVDDVDDTVGDAGLDEELDEALPERRRVGRRLEDDGVPGDERGRDLPRRDRDREVPRRDDADDADRHAYRHLELVAELRRGRLPEEAPALAAHVVAHVDGFLDVAAGLGLHLPHLVRHEVGQLGLVLDDELREAEEDLAALRRGDEAPVLECRLRGGDGAVDVVGAGPREGADQLAVGGARRVERLAGGGVDPLAADVVLKVLGCRRHGPQPIGGREVALPRDVRDDAAAVVERRVPLGERGLDLREVGAAVGEPDRLAGLGQHAVLVPRDLPGESEHELAVHTRERDDRDERRAERARDSLDRAPEEAGVEEVGGLDERRLGVGETTEHGLGDDRLRVAVRDAEKL